MLARLLLLAIAATAAQAAGAHEVRPAHLRIREIEPSIYDILWKTVEEDLPDLIRALEKLLGVGDPRLWAESDGDEAG